MNPYEILDVPTTATRDEIKRAYNRAAAKLHPDTGGDGDQFKRLADAWAILGDADRRKRYDETGDSATSPAPDLFVAILVEFVGRAIAADVPDLIREIERSAREDRRKAERDRKQITRDLARAEKRLAAFEVSATPENENAATLIRSVLRSKVDDARALLGRLDVGTITLDQIIDGLVGIRCNVQPERTEANQFGWTADFGPPAGFDDLFGKQFGDACKKALDKMAATVQESTPTKKPKAKK